MRILKRRRGLAIYLADLIDLTIRLCPIPLFIDIEAFVRRVHTADMLELRRTMARSLHGLLPLTDIMMLLVVVRTGVFRFVSTLALARYEWQLHMGRTWGLMPRIMGVLAIGYVRFEGLTPVGILSALSMVPVVVVWVTVVTWLRLVPNRLHRSCIDRPCLPVLCSVDI